MCPIECFALFHSLYLLLVLHAFGVENQFGIAQYWKGLGLHSPDLPRCIFIQILLMCSCCSRKRIQMARSRSNRVPHELQGVCVVVHIFSKEQTSLPNLVCRLVELIVLNIGLQANILDTRTFSMFVVHALVLTFITTPLVIAFYPPKYRIHHKGEKSSPGEEAALPDTRSSPDDERKTKFALILDKIESLPAAMTLSQLLHSPSLTSLSSTQLTVIDEKAGESGAEEPEKPLSGITIEALRLMELTNRTSAVLRSKEADSLIHNDPVVTVYRTFAQLNFFDVTSNISIVNYDEFPEAIARHASDTESEMVIIPWPRGITSVLDEESEGQKARTRNPFDGIFHKTTTQDQTGSVVYSEFIRRVFVTSSRDVALFVDRGMSSIPNRVSKQHLFLPFFGGPDDRLALSFLVQICENPLVVATVVRVVKVDSDADGSEGVKAPVSPPNFPTVHASVIAADTIYGQHSTQTRLASDTADNLLWSKYTYTSPPHYHHHHPNITSALSRISFRTENASKPLQHVVQLAKVEASTAIARSGKTLVVLVGRSRRLAVEELGGELRGVTSEAASAIGSSVPKTLGDVGAALVATNVDASLLVLQAAPSR